MNQPNPTPIPSERPADPMTAADGARLYNLIEQFIKGKLEEDRKISQRVASIQGYQLDILSRLERVEIGLSASRAGRLEAELKEAELEKDIAESNLEKIKAKLDIKREVKDQTLDTQEKIKTVAANTYANIEEKKRAEYQAWTIDLKRATIKAVVTALAVAGVFSALGFIWWLILLFVNRGGP